MFKPFHVHKLYQCRREKPTQFKFNLYLHKYKGKRKGTAKVKEKQRTLNLRPSAWKRMIIGKQLPSKKPDLMKFSKRKFVKRWDGRMNEALR